MSTSLELFEDVVGRSGLASFIGPGAVQRALQSVGVPSPGLANVEDYKRALPALRDRMAVYLLPEQLENCVHEIEALLRFESSRSAPSSRRVKKALP